jgi:hypothetical protein
MLACMARKGRVTARIRGHIVISSVIAGNGRKTCKQFRCLAPQAIDTPGLTLRDGRWAGLGILDGLCGTQHTRQH